jgi:hypothetical protein
MGLSCSWVTPTAARSLRLPARWTTWSVWSTSRGSHPTKGRIGQTSSPISPTWDHSLHRAAFVACWRCRVHPFADGLPRVICADIPAADAAFYAISQRPLADVALTEPAPTPAGRSRSVRGVFGTADRCIDPEVHRFSYKRMGATVTEVEAGSRVVMISHPKEVADVVRTAVQAWVVTQA